MKEKLKTIYEMIYGRDYELRERIFRMIILVGGGLALLGILECVAIMDVKIIVLPLILLLLVLGTELLITFKYRKIDIAAIIVGFLIILLVFPAMFFLSGGLEGGAVVWFALGLFYVFLMFSGKRLAFFLILSLAVDIFTYVYGYYHPDAITPMDSRGAAYFDSLFAVLAVGLAGGAILKVQMKMFENERRVAWEQQREIERISESKNSFFASMSHEIRTPINTIIGLNEMIIRESGEEATKEYAANIQSASKMLLNLVNDILDLSQMEMKKMEIIPLEYRTEELFGALIDMIKVRLQEKKLEFQVDIDENIPAVLLGDMKRVSQVLLNILTNAAKYTQEGSVTLSVQAEPAQEDSILLAVSVRDTGIGIRKEDLEHIYDSFKRADARKNLKVEGSGLGLSITKQLVDMMGGEITVDSIYTKGSVFTVTLPQKVVDKTPIGNVKFLRRRKGKADVYRQSFEAPEARILIVDDNPMNSMVESKLLKETKMKIDVAESGAQCLEMTKRKYYHVILLDYMMPEMNGAQTLRQLRKQENGLCRDSAVVVLSANSMAEAGKQYLEDGFDGYLEKPIQGDAMEAEILRFLPDDIIEYRAEPVMLQDNNEIQKVSRHKKKKVYITTDCVSDLPESLMDKYDIRMIYFYIKTEHGRFADTLEISSDNLIRYMTETTSNAYSDSVSLEEYEDFYADVLTQAEQVVHISVARNVGKSYDVAVSAAQGFDHVHVVDSGQISCGQALIVLYAGKLAMEGRTASQICEKIEGMKKRIESRYMMPSAKIFYERGYIGAASARICTLFGLHPTMQMNQSRMKITGAGCGRMEGAWKRFIHWHLLRKERINKDIVFITHAGCSVEQQELIRHEVLRCVPFERVIMQRASVSIACNSGIGTFGLAYYVNTSEADL
ncbi:MAG: DegV family EDD domain-containing protein [Bacillus sp. (in: Bacteria)]|nr:DegV family EDD domain-containing protein [Bacillus sp. (in: firmicutes)]MCM1426572.1 DegV family EDD domain-containing protein [Eubacterium sp.]